jgi:hypothetical protein
MQTECCVFARENALGRVNPTTRVDLVRAKSSLSHHLDSRQSWHTSPDGFLSAKARDCRYSIPAFTELLELMSAFAPLGNSDQQHKTTRQYYSWAAYALHSQTR